MTDRHGKEIPARGVTAQVDCGGCFMTIVNPFSEDSVEWALRYGNAERMRFVAASLVDSYDYLLSGNINMTEATRRLRLMRAKRRELMDAAIAGKAVAETDAAAPDDTNLVSGAASDPILSDPRS